MTAGAAPARSGSRTGRDLLADAWIGAVDEHLALRWGLFTPPWTHRAVHFAREDPHFPPAVEGR